MFKNILCAVDGSDHALRAAKTAAELAAKFGAKLTILTVAKKIKLSPEVKRYMQLEHLSGEPQYILDDYTENVIDQARAAARHDGVPEIKTEVREGHPARTIIEFAEKHDFDTIVLGSRGLGDMESTLLGSVSHKVATLAHCTVITVR
jgi:nucleotide-binding universal stress UspA family protein